MSWIEYENLLLFVYKKDATELLALGHHAFHEYCRAPRAGPRLELRDDYSGENIRGTILSAST